MKKIIITSLLIAFTFSISIAQKKSVSVTRDNNESVLQIKDDAQNVQLQVKGQVSFTDDEKAVEKLAQGSKISYRKNNDELEVTPGDNGSPVYTINGIIKTNLETADKNFIAQCVQLMIDNGVGAKERAAKLYSQGGFPLVLKEVDRISTDYARYIYLNYLGANHSLTDNEMLSFLNKIDTLLSSDYYRAELLNGIQENYLRKEVTANAYLENVKNIKSDYYQFTTLKKLLNSSLAEKQFEKVLSIVGSMKSDYYETEVLKMLLKGNAISDQIFSQLMNATANIKSDYYKSEIISSLLSNESLNKDRYSQTIDAMLNMKSNYYKVSILKKLINADIKDEKEWSKLLGYTAKINSDYEKSEVLIKIASKMPADKTLKSQFTEVAKSIGSDYYYGRVVRALDK